ncbi:condensation domain-containing protein [Streptomyces sp. M19]
MAATPRPVRGLHPLATRTPRRREGRGQPRGCPARPLAPRTRRAARGAGPARRPAAPGSGRTPRRAGRHPVGRGVAPGLVDLARQAQTSVFMVVHAALAALLTNLGAGEDIPIGTPIAGRTDETTDHLIGFFANTLVLRTDTTNDPTFHQLLTRVRTTDLTAYTHQDIPFERLVELTNPTRSLARHPSSKSCSPSRTPPTSTSTSPDSPSPTTPRPRHRQFDLSFNVRERHGRQGGGRPGTLEYNGDLFDRGSAAALAERFERTLRALVADPDRPLSRLDLLSEDERRRILDDWNETAVAGDPRRCRTSSRPRPPAPAGHGGRRRRTGHLLRRVERARQRRRPAAHRRRRGS